MGSHDEVTALITGGSDGIGKATAIRLCSEGANVAICARNKQRLANAVEEISAAGSGRVIGVSADCRDAEDLRRLYESTVNDLGPVTALVNNVGSSIRGAFLEVTDEQWVDDFNLKLLSAVRLGRMTIADMVDRRAGGRVVNVLSIGGKNPAAASMPTAMTRAAGLAFTKALSKEFAPHRILVNAVCIGTIKSGQHDRRWEAANEAVTRDEYYRRLAQQRNIPLGRVGDADEAASLISFLVSNEAGFLTGAAINLDGGAAATL